MGNKTYKLSYLGDKIKELLNKIDILSKKDIGLENVDNTSDVNKPVSILQKQEIKKAVDEVLVEAKKYTDNELATFDFIKIIDALPTRGLPNRIYLVPKTNTMEKDLFDEYLWINNQWEWITTKQIEVDLSTVEPKHFIINADYDITTNTILNADKTYEEVLSAYNNGNTPKLCLRAEQLIDSMPRVYTFELLFVGSMSVGTLGVMIFTNAYSILSEYNGNLIEAMFSIDNTWQIKLQSIDETPTENSSNAITSGGVYNALANCAKWVDIEECPKNDQTIVKLGTTHTFKNGNVGFEVTESGSLTFKVLEGYEWIEPFITNYAPFATRALYDVDYNEIHVNEYSKKPTVYVWEEDTDVYYIDLCSEDNTIFAYKGALPILEFNLTGSFSPDYTFSINFTSGETPTEVSYTSSGIINWVGTDCILQDGMSIFSPVANKRYNIVIYFDGITFVGCVNGFTPVTVNNSSVAEV